MSAQDCQNLAISTANGMDQHTLEGCHTTGELTTRALDRCRVPVVIGPSLAGRVTQSSGNSDLVRSAHSQKPKHSRRTCSC
jgi:hypothetical protein